MRNRPFQRSLPCFTIHYAIPSWLTRVANLGGGRDSYHAGESSPHTRNHFALEQ